MSQELLTGEQFVQQIQEIILNDGPAGADAYFHQIATKGQVDLGRLKALILKMNDGEKQKVDVWVHPLNDKVVPFMQEQLAREGVDFVELVAHYDDTIPEPKEPFVEKKASYDRWTKYRLGIVSMTTIIGLMAGAILPDQFKMGWSAENIDAMKILTSAIQSMFVISVEICTSIYSSSMDAFLWSPDRFQELRQSKDTGKRIHSRLAEFLKNLGLAVAALGNTDVTKIKEAIPNAKPHFVDAVNTFGRAAGDVMIKMGFNELSQLGNRLLDKKREASPDGKIKRNANFYNINIFNFVYMNTVFLVGYATSYFTGVAWDPILWHMGFSALSIYSFYFACAKNQNNIGTLKALGYIDEHTRLRSELMGLYFAKPWRILAEMGGPALHITLFGFTAGIPMLQATGIALQLLSGLLCTVPSTRRLQRIYSLAEETGVAFKKNAELAANGLLVEKPFIYVHPGDAPKNNEIKGIKNRIKAIGSRCSQFLSGFLYKGSRLPLPPRMLNL